MEDTADADRFASLRQASALIHDLLASGMVTDDRSVAQIGHDTHRFRDTAVSEACPLRCLNLSERTYKAVRYARTPKPATIGDLAQLWRDGGLNSVRGIGPRALGEIEAALIFIGVDLGRPQP